MLGRQILDHGIQYRSIKPRDIAKNAGCYNDLPLSENLGKSPFIGPFQCDNFYSHFRRFHKKLGEKILPGLVGSTDCLWPLHWRIHCPGRRFVPESSVRHIIWGIFCALTEKTLGTLSKGYDSSCDLFIRGQHIAIVKFPTALLSAVFSGHPKRLFARLIKKPAAADLSVRTLVGIS